MTVFVFVGPTLDRETASRSLDAVYLPPASQGDVYLAAREKPWGIGLIDGFFKHAPAVWHKEILWALSRGVHVFGAASMGALRAAELGPFGMQGIGRVHEQYVAGELEDDDEVTVIHSDADSGYRLLSDALVNIRATLRRAAEQRVITDATAETLTTIAKRQFYGERTFGQLLVSATGVVAASELARLKLWLPEGRIDQKRQDAMLMLDAMAERLRIHPEPFRAGFDFQHTDAWEQVRRQIHLKALSAEPGAAYQQGDAALSELRVLGPDYLQQQERALLHALCRELATVNGESVDASLVPGALNAFRLRHGLEAPGSVEPWLETQGLDLEDLGRLLMEDLTVQRQRALFDAELQRVLIEQLKLSGRYGHLMQRALEKQTTLARFGLHNPDLQSAGVTERELWDWYFERHLGLQGEQPDPDQYAQKLGYSGRAALRREVLRERLYQRHAVGGSSS